MVYLELSSFVVVVVCVVVSWMKFVGGVLIFLRVVVFMVLFLIMELSWVGNVFVVRKRFCIFGV